MQKKKSVKSRGNGQGTAYRRGNTWTACVTVGWLLPKDPSKPKTPIRKTKGGFKTKKDALNHCGTLMLTTPERRRITLEQLWNEWSESYESRVDQSTFAGYRSSYRHFKILHGTFMDQISVTELQNCINDVKGYRSRQLMKTTAGLLWRYCVAHNILDKDITGVLYLGKGGSVQRDPLTPDVDRYTVKLIDRVKEEIKYRDCGSCMEHHHGADSARETGCELYLAGRPVYGDHSFPSAKEERR